jgi:non-specific serine/threonine protein kinase/serine/threonine-protein kinase
MSAVAAGAARSLLRGDLDAIAAKALRKAPSERYASMAAFAADLHAWRTGLPVSAVRQSSWYRARRFLRRNRKAAIAGAALAVALAGGGVATAWQARIAAAERDKAQNRFNQVREFSRSLLFDVHAALRAVPGATESRRLLLGRAVQFLDGLAADAGDDDALLLELTAGYQQLANVQGNALSENVGDTAAALVSLEKASRLVDTVRTRRPGDGEALIRAIRVQFDLTVVQAERGDPRAQQSEQRHEALLRELENRHDTRPRTIATVAEGYSNVGRSHADRADFGGAEDAYRKSVALFESLPKNERNVDDLRSYSYALKRLGAVRLRADDYDESERFYRQALVLDDEVIRLDDRPQTRYDVTFTLSDLALVQSRRGRWDDAVAMWQRALAIRQAAVDADPKNTRALIGVATLYGRLGNAAAAQADPLASAARYRDELGLRDRVVAIVGPLPGRVSEQAWARLNLAQALLDSAAVSPRHPSHAAWVTEARRLVRGTGRGSGKVSVTAGSEPDYLELHDLLARRVGMH